MSLRQRLQLAEALKACDAMSQPDRRAVVVRALTGEVGEIRHSDVTSDHILNIIEACLGSRRGIAPLIEIVRTQEEGSEAFRKVEDVLENIRLSAVLTEGQRDTVVELIEDLDLPQATLQKLGKECLKVRTPQVPGEVDALVDHLAALGQQGDRPFPRPVLEFLERVALRPEATAVRARLRGIVAEVFTALGVPSTALEAARRGLGQAGTPAGRTLCVLVDLRPELRPGECRGHARPEEARYFLDVWVCQEDGTFLTDSPLGDPEAAPRPLAAIRADFMECLEALVDPLTQPGDELRIELLLPHELRGEGFDQWTRTADVAARVGHWCPVTVRCRDRLCGGRLFGPRQAWERHGTATLRQPPTAIKIIPLQRAADVDALLDALDALDAVEGRFCLVVAATPTDFADPGSYDALLQEAVDAGMAVGLWLRRRAGAADVAAAELLKLFQAPCLDQLPLKVLKLRKSHAAKKDADNLGNHVTLFWDDPVRVPPSLQLGAPRGRGTA